MHNCDVARQNLCQSVLTTTPAVAATIYSYTTLQEYEIMNVDFKIKLFNV